MPVESLESDTSYYIRTSYKGSTGTDTILKRKKADYDSALYEGSDFKNRYTRAFSKGLRDHRYASTFTLNDAKMYADDPEGQIYEIIGSGIDST